MFCVLHNKSCTANKRCSERGTRNPHQRIFRKFLTIYIYYRKHWSKDEFFMTLKKLRYGFLKTDLSQHFTIYLAVFALKFFIHMGMGKR